MWAYVLMRAWMANSLDVVAVGVSLPDKAFWDELHALMTSVPCHAEAPAQGPPAPPSAVAATLSAGVCSPATFDQWTVMPITRTFFAPDTCFLRFADRLAAMRAAAATGGYVADTAVLAVPMAQRVRALGKFLGAMPSAPHDHDHDATGQTRFALAPAMLWVLHREPAVFAEWVASFMDRPGGNVVVVSERARDVRMWRLFCEYLMGIPDCSPRRAWVLLNLFVDDELPMSISGDGPRPLFLRVHCSRKATEDGRIRVKNRAAFWASFLITPVDACDLQPFAEAPRAPKPKPKPAAADQAAATAPPDTSSLSTQVLILRGRSCQCPKRRVPVVYSDRDRANECARLNTLPRDMGAQQAAETIARGRTCVGSCASAVALLAKHAREQPRPAPELRVKVLGSTPLHVAGRGVSVACSGEPGRHHEIGDDVMLVPPCLWEAVYDAEFQAHCCRAAVPAPVTEVWTLRRGHGRGRRVEAVSFADATVPPFPLWEYENGAVQTLDTLCPAAPIDRAALNLELLPLSVVDYARPENDCLCAMELMPYDARNYTEHMTRAEGEQWYERYSYVYNGLYENLSKSARAKAVLCGCAIKRRR